MRAARVRVPAGHLHIISRPAAKHSPLDASLRQNIYLSAVQAKHRIEMSKRFGGLGKAKANFDKGKDWQAILKWDIRAFGSDQVNLSTPIHLRAIVQAARANNQPFFIVLGKLLQKCRKLKQRKVGPVAGFDYFEDLLLNGWIGLDRDTVDFTIWVPGERGKTTWGRMQSLGLCFFTDMAILSLAQCVFGLYKTNDPAKNHLDSIKKLRKRLGLKHAPTRIIRKVERQGDKVICR
jgi:hypothetical protein